MTRFLLQSAAERPRSRSSVARGDHRALEPGFARRRAALRHRDAHGVQHDRAGDADPLAGRIRPCSGPAAARAPGVECRVVDDERHRSRAGHGRRADRAHVAAVGDHAGLLQESGGDRATRGATAGSTPATRSGATRTGNFFFVDRMKDAIRRRGENISSFEVEAEACAHPAVREAAAVAVPSELGEDEVMLVVVPVAGRTRGSGRSAALPGAAHRALHAAALRPRGRRAAEDADGEGREAPLAQRRRHSRHLGSGGARRDRAPWQIANRVARSSDVEFEHDRAGAALRARAERERRGGDPRDLRARRAHLAQLRRQVSDASTRTCAACTGSTSA